MTSVIYRYSESTDFPNGIDIEYLDRTIRDNLVIVKSLFGVSKNGDNVRITFEETLSGAEQTELNQLIGDHTYDASLHNTVGDTYIVREVKEKGMDAGGITDNVWTKRSLNKISGTLNVNPFVDLDNGQLVFEKGTFLVRVSAPGFRCGDHVIRLHNVTDDVEHEVSQSASAGYASAKMSDKFSNVFATLDTIIRIEEADAPKTFEVQHKCSRANTVNGLGRASGLATEVYTVVSVNQTG
jgi:hypothetical protein